MHENATIYCTTYIKEDNIAVSISIMAINSIKPLRKLDIAELLPNLGIHQKAHSFPDSLAVVDVVITIQVQHEWCISKHCRNSNLLVVQIKGPKRQPHECRTK